MQTQNGLIRQQAAGAHQLTRFPQIFNHEERIKAQEQRNHIAVDVSPPQTMAAIIVIRMAL
jgi:hypothetical protein